jgi:hypothetical protein
VQLEALLADIAHISNMFLAAISNGLSALGKLVRGRRRLETADKRT